MADDKRACRGAAPTPCRMADFSHGHKCEHCGTKVALGYEDHWFFGFRQCDEKAQDSSQKGGES